MYMPSRGMALYMQAGMYAVVAAKISKILAGGVNEKRKRQNSVCECQVSYQSTQRRLYGDNVPQRGGFASWSRGNPRPKHTYPVANVMLANATVE